MAFANPAKNLAEIPLDQGMRVADIGAGSGMYALSASSMVGDNGVVYAIDVQKDLLTKLKSEARRLHRNNIEVVWADAEKLGGTKLPDDSVDVVILSNILFQTPDKRSILEESKRIVRSGGKILVVDWSDSFGGLGPKPADVLQKEEARALLSAVGLSLVKEYDAGDHHYGLLFVKK